MASSDDEGESVPNTVSNYYFVDDKDEPISFSELPIQWNESPNSDVKKNQIFMHGTTDNGLQKLYKQVIAWKFDTSNAKPDILVLCKDKNWIKLQKPRKSFEDTIRTILITVSCLHFISKNPETSAKSLWDHMSKVFSLYEIRPSENDLVDHVSLINEAVQMDENLAKSKVLLTFLEEKPRKRKASNEDIESIPKSGFIVDDETIDEDEDDGSDEEDDLFDSVCSICDNGGDLLCCEGRCMRSFHATVEAGSESLCKSLGLSDEQVEAIQNFFCKNCQYKQHQCFSCGELGSSDKSSGAEVFACVSATCGRFYHPHCVAKLLHRESEAEAQKLQGKIAAGESFTCPVHKCFVCKQGEEKTDPELQFAVCRRCPKSYHKKCLPRMIAFEDREDEGIIQRAWVDLIPNRILIYCLKHEIDDELGTPTRNHIKFPKLGEKKKKLASNLLSSKEKVVPRARSQDSEGVFEKRTVGKSSDGVKKLSSAMKEGDCAKKIEKRLSAADSSEKQKLMDASRKQLKKNVSGKVSKAVKGESGPSLGEMLFAYVSKGSEQVKSRKEEPANNEHEQTLIVKSATKESNRLLPLDDDDKRRIMTLIKNASSRITLEEIIRKHKVPSTHTYSWRNVVDKTITLGKVEGSIEALRAALLKLEEGCSIEDAKAVCEPGLLNQMVRWKNKLKVYLAPFLYGMRYTSFGRHFTKVDKLKEIVDMLHWYVQDGDTIVDFCCGANDFSCLMKKKLDAIGRKCSYKNFDVLQPKNDFNFEKRDWMTVKPKELPPGSQLIMGLNPPFGVNAVLANKFINKALEFKPKLLILIVPKETERLDMKRSPYDLVWEDDELLSGKSFYLPGSVDVNDKQMDQWNNTPPPLYLWSRPDLTAKHKAIAQQRGHSTRVLGESRLEKGHSGILVANNPVEDHDPNDNNSMVVDVAIAPNEEAKHIQERGAALNGSFNESLLPHNNDNREVHENRDIEKNQPDNKSRKRRRGKGKHGKQSGERLPEDKQRVQGPPPSDKYRKMPCRSPPEVTGGRSMDVEPPKPLEMPSPIDVVMEDVMPFDHSNAGVNLQFQSGYGGSRIDEITRRYSLNSEEPFAGAINRYSSGVSPSPDYGYRNPEEQLSGHQRETTDPRVNRSYTTEVDERYARESDLWSHGRSYGRQEPDPMSQRSSYLAGQDFGYSSSYANLGPVTNSSYNSMNSSTMQRYAPRLDELNHSRMNSLAPEPPALNRSAMYDPLAPRPGLRSDSLGFAPGPYRPFSQNNSSSGWLNE